MDDKLVCYGCGLIYDAADSDWAEDSDGDMAAKCPECGSADIATYEGYLEEAGQ